MQVGSLFVPRHALRYTLYFCINVWLRKHGIKSKSTGSKANRKLTIEKKTGHRGGRGSDSVSQIPKIFPKSDSGKPHVTPDLIRKYLEDAKVEVSSPRTDAPEWETASGKLNFKDRPSVPKPVGHSWENHPNPDLARFRQALPIYQKENEILDAVANCNGMYQLCNTTGLDFISYSEKKLVYIENVIYRNCN